jgi:hypothetical protein
MNKKRKKQMNKKSEKKKRTRARHEKHIALIEKQIKAIVFKQNITSKKLKTGKYLFLQKIIELHFAIIQPSKI